MRTLFKYLFNSLILLILLCVVIIAVALTPFGSSILTNTVNRLVIPLHLEYQSGSLLTNLVFDKVQWHDENIEIELEQASLNIKLSCLINGDLCLNHLKVERTFGNITLSPEPAEVKQELTEETNTESLISLPFLLSINELSTGEFDLTITDIVQLKWQKLDSAGHFYQQLTIDSLTVENLTVLLPAAVESTKSAFDINDIATWRFQPVQLEPLNIPILANVSAVLVADLLIFEGEQELLNLAKASFDVNISPNAILLKVNEFNHNLALVSGQLALLPNFEHSLTLDIELLPASNAAYSNIKTLSLSAEGSSLADINLALKVSGEQQLSAELHTSLIDPQLPIALKAKWQNIQGIVNSAKGELKLSGDLKRYQLIANADLNYQDFTDMSLELDIAGNNQVFDIALFHFKTPFLESTTQGNISFNQAIDFSGSLNVTRLNLQTFLPEITSEMSGETAFSGSYTGENIIVDMPNLALSGTWLDHPMLLDAVAHYDQLVGLQLNKFNFKTSDNSITGTGYLNPDQSFELNGQLNAANLAALIPGAAGRLHGDINLSGLLNQPNILLAILGEKLSYQGVTLEKLAAQANINWFDDKQLNIKMQADKLDLNEDEVVDVTIEALGTPEQHTLAILSDGPINKIVAHFNGQITENQWQGEFTQGEISHYANQLTLVPDNVLLLLDWQKAAYQISPHCWIENTAKLCIKEAVYENKVLNFSASGEQLPIFTIASQWEPSLNKIHTDSLLTFSVNTQWDISGFPQGEVNAYLTPATWVFDGLDKEFILEQFSFNAISNPQGVQTKFLVNGPTIGAIKANGVLNNDPLSRNVVVNVQTDKFILSPWSEIIPSIRHLNGTINTDLAIEYSNENLNVIGTAMVTGGELSFAELDTNISAIEQTFVFNGDSVVTNGKFNIGAGTGELLGSFYWRPSFSGEMQLTGQNLEINDSYRIKAKISPNLKVNYHANQLDIQGNVVLPYARIKVNKLPESALNPSNDAVVIGENYSNVNNVFKQNIAVSLLIDPNKKHEVKLDAFGLKTDLQGNLTLTTKQNALQARGELRLVNGTYKAYGQNLQIQQGDLLFNGPVDSPSLIVNAIRAPDQTADNVVAGLKLRGLAQSPKIEVFSVPDLSESQALSYLLRGQAFYNNNDESQDVMLTNMLISLGLGQSENSISWLGETVGINDLNVATQGLGEETKVLVNGTIAKGVSVSYGVGVFDSSSQVSFKYQILPKLYIEAISGLTSAIDIYYQLTIDGKNNETQAASNAADLAEK